MTDISHLTLETRACICGCANTFRCLPTSPQRFCMLTHNKAYNEKGLRFDEDFEQPHWTPEHRRRMQETVKAARRKTAVWRAYLAGIRKKAA
jgi:hypothetical protein